MRFTNATSARILRICC